MAVPGDLLRSLIQPPLRTQSSDESFHSTNENLTKPPPDSSTPASQEAHYSFRDVDDYFSDPTTAALLNTNQYAGKQGTGTGTGAPQPVPLGSKTSYHVAALNTASQAKRLGQPIYEIEGQNDIANFGGLVRIGGMTIDGNRRWNSKKEAKEALAEEAMKSVMGIEAKRKEQSPAKDEKENWIGMLQGECCEYLLNLN